MGGYCICDLSSRGVDFDAIVTGAGGMYPSAERGRLVLLWTLQLSIPLLVSRKRRRKPSASQAHASDYAFGRTHRRCADARLSTLLPLSGGPRCRLAYAMNHGLSLVGRPQRFLRHSLYLFANAAEPTLRGSDALKCPARAVALDGICC